jgi:hypothetical protein
MHMHILSIRTNDDGDVDDDENGDYSDLMCTL